MKKLLLVFTLVLLLTGCGKTQQSPAPEQPPKEPDTSISSSEAPAEVPVADETPQSPDEPAVAAQTAAFLWNDTALAKDGTVVLQVPEHRLQFLMDEITRKPRYLLALDEDGAVALLYTLDGTFLQELDDPSFFLAGSLSWSGFYGNQQLTRFPDGEVLADGLRSVFPVGDQLALIPTFQRSSISFWDPQTGTETCQLDAGFLLADPTFLWSGSGYLPVTSPIGDGINLVDSQGTPLLGSFVYDIIDVCYGYAIVQPEETSTMYALMDLSTRQVLSQTVFGSARSFVPLPSSALICQTDRQWILVDWQGNRLFDEVFTDCPIVFEADGTPQYLVGQVLRGTQFIPVILTPTGTVLGELPGDPLEIGPVSSRYLLYTTSTGSQQIAYLRDLETGTDTLLAKGSRIVLGGLQASGDGTSHCVMQIETSGGHMFTLRVDGQMQLFLNDGTPGRLDLGEAEYLGSDVFSTATGLRCLDGSWLYQP